MKNKTIFSFHLFFGLIILLSSCSVKNNYYYVPPEGNILTLSERNDLKISASTSVKDKGISNFQIGYSPIKYVGLFGSWMKQKNGKGIYPYDVLNFESDNSASYKSIAIGGYIFKKRDIYYSTLFTEENIDEGGFLADLYFGIGKGEFTRRYNNIRAYIDFDYQKIYGQLGLHYKFRTFGISGFLKIGQLNFKNILAHGNFTLFPNDFFYELRYGKYINSYETGLRLEYGIRQVKINFNFTYFSNQPNFSSSIRSYYSVGVLLNIGEFFRKKRKDKI